ncbi:glycosyltransferase family 4 protein [bacterium]|nr:glycosyltransferase family 4 protein [candidate division CSSED10-310 bacterium]
MNHRMRIAVFSPVSPVKSGVSRYTEQLVTRLHEWMDIDVYLDGYGPESDIFSGIVKARHRREFEWRHLVDPYDSILYHIGNNRCHHYIYPVMFRHPGVVVLHDVNLHRARAFGRFKENRLGDYLEEIRYCHGETGEGVGWIVAKGFAGQLIYDRFPMLKDVCEAACGIIVHNDYSKQAVLDTGVVKPVRIVPFPYHPEPLPEPGEARSELGLRSDRLVIAAFGFVVPGKGLESTLKAFERFAAHHGNCCFLMVGECLDPEYLDGLMQSLPPGIQNSVVYTGFVPEETFRRYIAAADICVNLRYPAQGESSSALLRVMGASKPVLVSRYRQYRELPGDACVHIDLYPDEAGAVFRALIQLAGHPDEAAHIGRLARKYVEEKHRSVEWVDGIREFITDSVAIRESITPFASISALSGSGILSIPDHVALVLTGWGSFIEDDIILSETDRIIGELGIEE